MDSIFTLEDRNRIKEGITAKYGKVAVSPEGNFKYPTGRGGLEGQHYDPEILKVLPEEVLASYCGVGNPFSLGPIHKGETVLDVGCGAGVDTLVAAMMVGPEGKAVGIDLTSEMLDRARANLEKTSLGNVSFQEGSAEELPFADEIFDVVISNGVFNLVPDKPKALREIFRVLRPQGRLMMADQILAGEMEGDIRSMVESWAR
jgi:SAM-dependent methyltransferase